MFKYCLNYGVIMTLSLTLFCSCTWTKINWVQKDSNRISDKSSVEAEVSGIGMEIGRDKPHDNRKRLQLAMKYSHHSNLNPKYKMALDYLEEYRSGVSETDLEYFADYIYGLVEEVAEQKDQAANLMKKIRGLEKKNNELEKDNQQMAEKISKLKYLDIRLDKKRIGLE